MNLYGFVGNNGVNGVDPFGLSEEWFIRQLFSPITEAFNAVSRSFDQSVESAAASIKEFVEQEMEQYKPYSREKTSFSRTIGRKWSAGLVTARLAGTVSISSDGCCVSVKWGPTASVTGKIPVWGPITLRPSGTVSLTSGYKYCWTDDEGIFETLDLSVTLAFGVRAGVELGAAEAWVEGGGYVNGTWDLKNGTHTYSSGLYFRGVYEVGIFGFFDRGQVKWSSGSGFDVL